MTEKDKRIISLLLRAKRRAEEKGYGAIYINGLPALWFENYEFKIYKGAVALFDHKNMCNAAYISFYWIKEIDVGDRTVLV